MASVSDTDVRKLRERAQADWPAVAVAAAPFRRAVEELVGSGISLDRLDPGELWLALGCAAGEAPALRAFEDHYFADLGRSLGHMRLSPEMLDDALQTARRRLLVATDGGVPKVVGYAGRGQLHSMVRVVATRAALDLLRGQGRRREVAEDELSAVLLASANPESVVGRDMKAEIFRRAFEAAVAALPADDRSLLRLYAVDGVGLDGLARVLGIHRSTVARRLAKVRTTIFEATHARLGEEGLEGSELRSVIEVVDAGLELTLSRILAEPEESAGGAETDETDER